MNARRLLPFLLALVATPVVLEGQEGDYTRIDTTFAFTRAGRVELGLVSGEIEVIGWSREEIRIVATLERGRLDRSYSPTRVALTARSIRGRVGRGRYQITVPFGTTVSASGVSADILVRETKGALNAQSVSGTISVRESANRATLNSVSGSIRVTDHTGRVSAESVSGTITLDGVSGDVELESVSGAIRVRGGRIPFFHAETISGDISFDGSLDPNGLYEVSSHSGDLRLALPASGGARVELQTHSGTIRSDFPITLQPGESISRRPKSMKFTVGTGGARLTAQTFSGSIIIQRAVARPNED